MVHTILVIDGEAVQRDLLIHSLQHRLGYRASGCASAAHVANSFQEIDSFPRPDLMVFDWASCGGEEALASLKEFSACVPLVALVKYGDYAAGAAALAAGAQDFLTKPVAIERISATFRNLLLLRDACLELERLRGGHDPLSGSVLLAAAPEVKTGLPIRPFTLLGNDGNILRMGEIEAEAIRFAMQYYHGRMTEVARRLGIGRSTLYRKLSELEARQAA